MRKLILNLLLKHNYGVLTLCVVTKDNNAIISNKLPIFITIMCVVIAVILTNKNKKLSNIFSILENLTQNSQNSPFKY